MKIEIRKSRAKQPFIVRYIADNGKVLATSENLSTHAEAIKNIKAMKRLFGVGDINYNVRVLDYSKSKEPVISQI